MPSEREMAEKFAPIMNLHPNERYLPMDAADFVGSSRLWRARANVGLSVYDVEAKQWDADPDKHSDFHCSVELLADWDVLHGPDDASWSRRPHDERLATDGEQYALEHRVQKPTAPFDPAKPPPCYYYVQPWKDSTLISYWFFYGYSEFLSFIAHQGDWEHATLRIRDGVIVSGFYAVHEDTYYVEAEDLEWRNERLQVYSAKGRHATWWKKGKHVVGLSFFQKKEKVADLETLEAVLQDETAAGQAWDVRKNLQSLGGQPWRHFAGAWGKIGGAPHATGPLGPWFKRRLDPDEKVIME